MMMETKNLTGLHQKEIARDEWSSTFLNASRSPHWIILTLDCQGGLFLDDF